jgi:hypothetical protein
LGVNHFVVIGNGREVDGVEDVAVKGASAAVYFGDRRRGEVAASVASMRERKKTIVFPRVGPTGW